MILFEVVREFLDEDNNVYDFVVIDDFHSREVAFACASLQTVNDNTEQIVIYKSDDNGNVLDSDVVKTYNN